MLYADAKGRIFEHPHYRMVGFSGETPDIPARKDLIALPEFSKLFFMPDCPPLGVDPYTGEIQVVTEAGSGSGRTICHAVAVFLEPGYVRSHLPAADYREKKVVLPMWAYTAVGYKNGKYRTSGYLVEYNPRWDPRNYDDRVLLPAIKAYKKKHPPWPLITHLEGCATKNHCFAAKNLFLERWEAPIPVSRSCNASCVGCLSLQKGDSCTTASHQRISFRPSREEVVDMASAHLETAPKAIISFGQGCEGEPLTEYRLIAECIEGIRKKTKKGTINLNTNGSSPERIALLARSGLDSIRISLNSARPPLYHAYYRPKDYRFEDVEAAIALSTELGLYTMVNYLVFPGVTDQEAELEALGDLLRRTGVHFLHMKNLNIDPTLYLKILPEEGPPALGMRRFASLLTKACPDVRLGYFNQPVR